MEKIVNEGKDLECEQRKSKSQNDRKQAIKRVTKGRRKSKREQVLKERERERV